MILVLKNLLAAADRSLLARTVKTEQAPQVYLVRVKRPKLVLTVFVPIVLRKVVTLANQKVKTLALEIQIPTLLVVSDAESSEANVNKLRIGTTKL